MDGLMKGLMNVALDALGDGRGNEDNRDRQEQRDERSRSSWAEVVSGDNESHDNDSRSSSKRTDYDPSRPSAHHPQRRNKDEEEPRPKWQEPQPRKNYKNEGESNDGWETVPKKHSKQRHEIPRNEWDKFKRPAEEQLYSDEVDSGIAVSDEELSDLSRALNKLWELDSNRLVPGRDYQIDCGEGKKVYQKDDMAQGNLFSWLSDDVFRKPTYSRFCSLLDNYNPEEGYKEVLTSEERQEQASFIEEISRTQPIKYLHQYLSAKGMAARSFQEFKRTMEGLWFDLYGRGGTSRSSSAFEHVFVGEIKGRGEREVSGFHNWIQFYLEEAKGNVDYQGYIFPRRRGQVPDAETQLLTVQFEWRGVLKSVSSSFVGVSPEFEIALYTLCFYAGGEDNYVELGPYSVNIKCYRLGRDRIGSAFPIAES